MIRIDTDSYIILGQKYGLPSQKCGMSGDMFEIKGGNYLVITDYQSKFHVVQKTTSTTSNKIAHMTAE